MRCCPNPLSNEELTLDLILHGWGSFLIRWTHVVAAIAGIGAPFNLIHLDASIKAAADIPEGREACEVHGRGFYQARKRLVSPATLPDHLIWHKPHSYSTSLSGVTLLCWARYLEADLYLINPAVRSISPLAGAAHADR